MPVGRASATNWSQVSCVEWRQCFDNPAIRNDAAAALLDDAVEFGPQRHEVGDLALDPCEVLSRDLIHSLA